MPRRYSKYGKPMKLSYEANRFAKLKEYYLEALEHKSKKANHKDNSDFAK